MSYVLRFPFKPQSRITGLDDASTFQAGALSIRLCNRDPYIIVEVHGFETDQQAAAYVPVVWAALRWVLIDRQLNSTCETTLQTIVWANDAVEAGRNLAKSFGQPPELAQPVDGLGDEGWPSVYQEGQRLRYLAGGQMTGKVTSPMDSFITPFQEAVGWKGIESWFEEPRFRLASDLLSAFHFESSSNARLVTLGMALEVLAEPIGKHPAALVLLDSWATHLAARKLEAAGDHEAFHALESLERELITRRDASIRSRVRRTAIQLGSVFGDDEATSLARDAVDVYDARSALVHDGKLIEPALSQAVEKGRETVRRLLQAVVLKRRNTTNSTYE